MTSMDTGRGHGLFTSPRSVRAAAAVRPYGQVRSRRDRADGTGILGAAQVLLPSGRRA
ncbi:hypothetical protein [Streptomyces yanii]|uniref:Uncharacterized protein n=1 Tax=Streptomyces yanii TaxID=78510 RepID=A0ABV5R864_9ACTN